MSAKRNADWKSVRPVRFRSQIFGVLAYIVERDHVTIPELAGCALELRNQREDKRLQALRRKKPIGPRTKDPHRQRYLTVTEQLIRVLRSTNFIVVKNNIVLGTELARELIAKNQKDELSADKLFLERLFNSRFSSYWLYLKQLFKSRELFIPREFSKRDSTSREYLRTKGFPLTVWSFFILRDLFYEFSLLNYIVEESGERIFPLYTLDSGDKESYNVRVKYPEGYIYYWKKIKMDEFENVLIQVYHKITSGWDRMGSLIELREKVSEELGISERQFNIFFEKALNEAVRIKIYPSIGALSSERRRGYMTKVISLPISSRGYPFTLVRISRRGA